VEDTGPGFASRPVFMPKFALTKTIEAAKLNPRTLRPLTPIKSTIPYSAILEKMKRDGDMLQFYYLGEPYECHHSDIDNALDPVD
jgi:hypothetical protein